MAEARRETLMKIKGRNIDVWLAGRGRRNDNQKETVA